MRRAPAYLRKLSAVRVEMIASGSPLDWDDNVCSDVEARRELKRRTTEETGKRAQEAAECLRQLRTFKGGVCG